MLTLRDTKVMKFAFTAIATASTLYGLASIAGVAEAWHLVPRVMPFLGGAHILGGIIFGVAMGTTGICPGTCVAKAGGMAGDKKFATLFAILGLVLGVLAYAVVKTPLTDAGVIAVNQKPITLNGLLGLPYGVVALIWGALFFVISVVVNRFTPETNYPSSKERKSVLDYIRGEWSWLASGVVGGIVIVLATMQNGYLGFSGAVLALVGGTAHLIGLPMELVPKINDDIIWRAMLIVGVFPGAFLAQPLVDQVGGGGAPHPPAHLQPRGVRQVAGGRLRAGAGRDDRRRLHHRRVHRRVAHALHRQPGDGRHVLRRLDGHLQPAHPHAKARLRQSAEGRRRGVRLMTRSMRGMFLVLIAAMLAGVITLRAKNDSLAAQTTSVTR